MEKIDCDDDFRLRLRLPGIGAAARWEMFFYTGSVTPGYKAWYDGREYHNAVLAGDDTVIVNFDGHNLGRGSLTGIVTMYIPSPDFPDGTQRLTKKYRNLAELVDGPGDCPTEAEAEVLAPFIRGKDALEYAREAGYEGDAEAFARDLAAVGGKVDKVEGKGLSECDYTSEEKAAVEALPEKVQPLIEFDAEDFDYDKETGSLAVSAAAERRVFNTAFNNMAGSDGGYRPEEAPDEATPYLINGLWMSFTEAIGIISLWPICQAPASIGLFAGISVRTLAKINGGNPGNYIDTSTLFSNCRSLVRVRFEAGCYTSKTHYMFYNCNSLKEIIGTIYMLKNTSIAVTYMFIGCGSLTEVRIHNLMKNISFAHCSQLSLASLQYLISNAANTVAITVTVHSSVYARIIDEGSGDWHALLEAASAKNISFATI